MLRLCLASLPRGALKSHSPALILPASSVPSLLPPSPPSLLVRSSPLSTSLVSLRTRNQKRPPPPPPPPPPPKPEPEVIKPSFWMLFQSHPVVVRVLNFIFRYPVPIAVVSFMGSFLLFNITIRKFYAKTSQATSTFQVLKHLMEQSTEMVEMFGDPEKWIIGMPFDDNSGSSRVVTYRIEGETGAVGSAKINYTDGRPIPRVLETEEVISRISTLLIQMRTKPTPESGVNETTRDRSFIVVVAPPYMWHAARKKEKLRIESESSEKYVEEMTPELEKERHQRREKILRELDALIEEGEKELEREKEKEKEMEKEQEK